MIIFHKFISIILVIFIGGCIGVNSNQITDENAIIAKHVSAYAVSTNSQNDDIAAILREFSSFVYTNKFISWNHFQNLENEFMSNLKTNYISPFYTIFPSDEEIRISDNFLDNIIMLDIYYNPDWIYKIQQRIPTITAKFITKMNDYEYNKKTDK